MIPIEGSFELTVGSVCLRIPVTSAGFTGGHVQDEVSVDTRTTDTTSKASIGYRKVAHLEEYREMDAHFIIAHARRNIYRSLSRDGATSNNCSTFDINSTY